VGLVVGGGGHNLQTGKACIVWSTSSWTQPASPSWPGSSRQACLPEGCGSPESSPLSSSSLGDAAWTRQLVPVGYIEVEDGPCELSSHIHVASPCALLRVRVLGWVLAAAVAHSAVPPLPRCPHGTVLSPSCRALQTTAFPQVRGAARKCQVGFSARRGRCLLPHAGGAEGISVIHGLMLQKPPCSLSVSFSGCRAMRVRVSQSHVRREKPRLFC